MTLANVTATCRWQPADYSHGRMVLSDSGQMHEGGPKFCLSGFIRRAQSERMSALAPELVVVRTVTQRFERFTKALLFIHVNAEIQ